MIQFIYGRAGSGKTTLLFDKIKELSASGKKILLLVPEQQVFETEKKLCGEEYIGLNVEVAGFRRLCNMIFRRWGGLSYHYIGNGAKLIVMWRTLRELKDNLGEYGDLSLDDISVLKLLQKTIDEFQRYNISAADLELAAEKLPPEEKKLGRKLLDLSMIMTLNLKNLHDNFDNPEEDLPRAAKILETHDCFSKVTVFIDGFTRFAPAETEVLKNIFAKSEKVYITVPYLPRDNSEMMRNIKKSDRSLHKLADMVGCGIMPDIVCENTVAPISDDLRFLRENIWKFDNSVYDCKPENISVVETSDIYSEAEACACKIARLVEEEGIRYREIAIIARNPSSYSGILDVALEKYSIPCFISSRTGLCMKPQIRMITSALSVIAGHWRTEDVISYMRCGLSGLTSDECDLLEEYASSWNISGKLWYGDEAWTMNPNGFTAEFTDAESEKLEKLTMLRDKLCTPLASFGYVFEKDTTVRQASAALFELLKEMKIAEKLADEEALLRHNGNLSAAEESVQIWDIICGALDSLVTVAGDMIVSANEYLRLLLTVFESADIGKVPARADEVLIGEPKLIHRPGIKHAFILGLNEGVFPTFGDEGTVFNDRDKEALSELGIELADNSESYSASELYGFYRSVSIPEKSLTLSYHSDINPSVAVYATKSVFPLLETEIWDKADALYKIRGKTTAFEFCMANPNSENGKKIYSLLCDISESESDYSKIHSQNIPIDASECKLQTSTVDALTHNGLNLTQARVENFVKCPFSYYMKNVLSLKEEVSDDFEFREVGNFVHAVFEKFFKKLGEKSVKTTEDSELYRIAESAVDECKKSITHGVCTPRLEHLFERLDGLSMLFIKNLIAEFRDSDFEPKFFELPIDNKPGDISPLNIEFGEGKKITVYGRVDRVDILKKDNDVYLRVVDYKTGSKKFSLKNIDLGLDFQLPIYLFSICSTSDADFRKKVGVGTDGEIRPAGLLYYSARSPKTDETIDSPIPDTDNLMRKAVEDIEKSGLLLNDNEVISAMERSKRGKFIPVKFDKDGVLKIDDNIIDREGFDNLLKKITDKISSIGDEIASGKAFAIPMVNGQENPCKYCGARKICRVSDK